MNAMRHMKFATLFALGVCLLLVSCGGGSAGPAPVVNIAFESAKGALGIASTFSWTSTYATSCAGQDGLIGVQPLAGSKSVTLNARGQFKYTMVCSGPGGTTSATAVLQIPLAVLSSSYENSAAATEALGSQPMAGNAVAFADFFQDGSYSMVSHTLEYDPSNLASATSYGRIQFWKQVDGAWQDKTSQLMSDTTGCLHPRKAIVADFNQSGRPSVLFACHGFDASPYPGESMHLLLSKADGTYSHLRLPFIGYFHSASAADVNGDGYPDVVVADPLVEGKPYVLLNQQNGSFSKDTTRFHPAVAGQKIYTAELINFYDPGKYDVFLGGYEQSGNWPAAILVNDGAGRFPAGVRLPSVSGFGLPTDIVFKNGYIFLARTIDASTNFYGGAAIQKINFQTSESSLIHEHYGAYANGRTWINWIRPHSWNIVSMDQSYGVTVAR
jgi:hypothetical protein